MAEQQATLAAAVRTEQGTSPVRRLRQDGRIPGVMYAEGAEATSLSLDAHAFQMELRRHSSDNVMISINVDGQGMKKVLVKDVQRHPLTKNILHVDLQAVSMTEKLRVDVTIELIGDPGGGDAVRRNAGAIAGGGGSGVSADRHPVVVEH